MITEAEFLKAIELIKNYNEQISNMVLDATTPKKTKISDWVKDNRKYISENYPNTKGEHQDVLRVSTRMFNGLMWYDGFIEDLELRDLRRITNFGKSSIDLFFKLKNKSTNEQFKKMMNEKINFKLFCELLETKILEFSEPFDINDFNIFYTNFKNHLNRINPKYRETHSDVKILFEWSEETFDEVKPETHTYWLKNKYV